MKRIILLALVALIAVSVPLAVLAADITGAKYKGRVVVENTGATATSVATVATIDTDAFVTLGYFNAAVDNMTIRNESSVDVPFMPGYGGNPWCMWVPSIGENKYLPFMLYTADVTGGLLSYFPGATGMSVDDADIDELGDNFRIGFEDIYLDTSVADVIAEKPGALSWTTDGAGRLIAGIGDTDFSQVISGGGGKDDVLAPGATEYNTLMGGNYWTNTESVVYQVMPTAGTLESLVVNLSAAIPAGTTYTFTIMKNGGAESLAATINGSSSGSNTVDTVSFVAGDTVSIRSTSTGAPGTPFASWSTIWKPTITGEGIFLATTTSATNAVRYSSVQGAITSSANTTLHIVPMPTDGTFSKLTVKLSADPGNAPNAYAFTLRKNAADTLLTTTISADDTTGSDTVNTVEVVAGDEIVYSITPLNVPATAPQCAISMVFTSNTAGESVVTGSSSSHASIVATNYYAAQTGSLSGFNWLATENTVVQTTQESLIGKFFVLSKFAPDSGAGVQSVTLNIREAGAGTGLTVTIAEAETSGNDVANSFLSSDGALVSIEHIPNTTEVNRYYAWSFVRKPFNVITTAAVPSGHYDSIEVIADGTDLNLDVDGVTVDTVALGGASVPDNAAAWQFGSNATLYIGAVEVDVSGTPEARWEWEYGDTFTDSINSIVATPTFRTTSSDADVSAELTTFGPVEEAKAPPYALSEQVDQIQITPDMSGNFNTEAGTGTFPLAGVIAALAAAGDTPAQLPLTIIAGFVIVGLSLSASAIMRRFGSGGLIVKTIIIVALMGIFVALGNFAIEFWMVVVFIIMAVSIMFASKQLGW